MFLLKRNEMSLSQHHNFLTNGKGFRSICHRFDIFFREGSETQFNNAMWENFGEKHNLKRMYGFIKFHEGKSSIRLENGKTSSERWIEIRKIRTGKKEFLSEEPVYFYIGFSIAGPIAYNVKPTRHEDIPNNSNIPIHLDDKVEHLMHETEDALQKKLDFIQDLKSKEKNGRKIQMRDRELMNEEQDIRTALDIKRTDPYTIDIE